MLNSEKNEGNLTKYLIPKAKREYLKNFLRRDQLYDGVSIDIWKIIAECVQKFTIIDGSEAEIEHNKTILKKALKGKNVSFIKDGVKEADFFLDVGLETLIYHIYQMAVPNIKDYFSSQIETLSDIGVDSIAFNPCKSTIGKINGIAIYKENKFGNYSEIDKVYTDGTFIIQNNGGYSHLFDIERLMGSNYHIGVVLVNDGNNTKLVKAKANLENFQGRYPTRSEMLSFRQPLIAYSPLEDERSEKFLRDKKLYEEYLDYISYSDSQNPMKWHATDRRVQEVLKKQIGK